MKTIEQMWQVFKAHVINDKSGEVEKRERRKMFFAGAYALFAELNLMIDEPEEILNEWLIRINNELEEFRKEVVIDET